MLFLADGECLQQPDLNQLADRLGLQTRAGAEFYDLAIVGGGPAGLAAAVYGASEGLKTVMLESEAPGGQSWSRLPNRKLISRISVGTLRCRSGSSRRHPS